VRGFTILLTLVGLLAAGAFVLWIPSPEEPGYRFDLAWGEKGSGPGQFREPIGIALLGNEIYVSDAGNHRIQVFDHEGRFLRSFGKEGDGRGELARPMHIYAREGKLYVAEYLNDRIHVFSPEGESLALIGSSGSGPGEFDAPGGVAADPAGRLYVADFYNQRVQVLSPGGDFIRQFGMTAEKGIWAGRFNYPTDVDLLSDTDVVVADAYNDRIQVFAPDGEFERKWGGPFALNIPGGFNGWFRTATGVAVDPESNIFVADFYNHRVQKFSSRGHFLVAFGEQGSGPGQLERPTDAAVDANGNVYVVDFGNNRIQKFEPITEKFEPITEPAERDALEKRSGPPYKPMQRQTTELKTDARKSASGLQPLTGSGVSRSRPGA